MLDRTECASLLARQTIGRLAYVVRGGPIVVPMNYALDGDYVIFRTGAGTKFSVLRSGAPAALEVDSFDPVYHSGWSVLVLGDAEEVRDEAAIDRLRSLDLQPWDGDDKDFWIALRPTQMTGRRLPKAWRYPDPVIRDRPARS